MNTDVCSTRAERAYEASMDADVLREKDKHNSIFVSALKEHLDNGTLDQRLDTLLSDAAANVCCCNCSSNITMYTLHLCV